MLAMAMGVKGLTKGLRRSFLAAFGVKTKALGLNGVFLRGDQLWFELEKVDHARSYFWYLTVAHEVLTTLEGDGFLWGSKAWI
jgi:hypothetical protein